MRLGSLAVSLSLALGLAVPLAHADGKGAKDAPATAPSTKKHQVDDSAPLEGAVQHQEGEYEGVKAGTPQKTEGGKPVKRPPNGTLAWVGFSADGGAGHLFLQAPTSFQYAQSLDGKELVVHLSGIARLARNVRRPLDTHFFDSPVAHVAVARVSGRRARKGHAARAAGVEVRIRFKHPADAHAATARTALEGDGYFYLYLDFDASTATTPTPATTP